MGLDRTSRKSPLQYFSPWSLDDSHLLLYFQETEPSDPLVIPGVPQFNYRNPPKFKQPLLVKKYQGPKRKEEQDEDADVSSSDSGSVFGGNAKLNLSQAEKPSQVFSRYLIGYFQ